jgi:hypothetical protein
MRHISHLFQAIKRALNAGHFAKRMHSLQNALLVLKEKKPALVIT